MERFTTSPENPVDTLGYNRQGRLTPDQRVMLNFLLEAQRLGAGLGGLAGFGSLVFFGCILAWGLGQDPGWAVALEFLVLLGFGAYSIWNARRVLTRLSGFARSLQSERVAFADGEIAWNGRRYAARVPVAEKLDLAQTYIPGDYRFYYVPFSGRVLSAERLCNNLDARDCLLQSLMDAFSFNAEALAANRMGRVGDAQRTVLMQKLVIHGWTRMLGTLAGGVVFVTLMVNFQIARGVQYGWTSVLAAAPFVILFIKLLADYLDRLGDLRTGRVETVQGLGYRPANSNRWQIHLNQFSVPRKQSGVLISGLRYRAFYLPRSRYLISLEPLAFPKVTTPNRLTNALK